MPTTKRVVIRDGRMEFVYDDDLLPLTQHGTTTIRRVSHVEPAPGGGWYADMRPVGGPVLFANGQTTGSPEQAGDLRGFTTREDALRAEREYLGTELGL